MQKKCRTCSETLSLESFGKLSRAKDGKQTSCIICLRKYRRTHYINNKEKYIESSRKHIKNNVLKVRASKAKWQKNNKEQYKEICKASHLKNKIKRNKDALNKRIKYRNYAKAHYILNNSIRDGYTKKKDICEECGINGKSVAHHDDYLEPLIVKWFCRTCHKLWHDKNGPGKNR